MMFHRPDDQLPKGILLRIISLFRERGWGEATIRQLINGRTEPSRNKARKQNALLCLLAIEETSRNKAIRREDFQVHKHVGIKPIN